MKDNGVEARPTDYLKSVYIAERMVTLKIYGTVFFSFVCLTDVAEIVFHLVAIKSRSPI